MAEGGGEEDWVEEGMVGVGEEDEREGKGLLGWGRGDSVDGDVDA